MVLIHISGTPGSGKSTLGVKLQKMFPDFKIVETDGFVSHNMRKKRDELKTLAQKKKFIFDIYKQKFNYYNDRYEDIIYVGILDSSVPDGTLYTTQKFDYNIFLKVSDVQLLKRYYIRRVSNDILTDDKYIKMVINNELYILSSKEVLEWNKKNINDHEKLKYKFMTENQIINLIKKLKKS